MTAWKESHPKAGMIPAFFGAAIGSEGFKDISLDSDGSWYAYITGSITNITGSSRK